ncbi:hypothetical protein NDU88_002716 [Pleurodeles waltl]|uniref:Uncharacterized protein n=1 Tax=Pleurodeles waltl TaxID=8319 RepID=A0AAV7LD93_PLEWA|nr:hypothetical protein NDU88_002716 [Pleurodeles waltl]
MRRKGTWGPLALGEVLFGLSRVKRLDTKCVAAQSAGQLAKWSWAPHAPRRVEAATASLITRPGASWQIRYCTSTAALRTCGHPDLESDDSDKVTYRSLKTKYNSVWE